MFRKHRKNLFDLVPFRLVLCSVTLIKPMPACAFCTMVRVLIASWAVLSSAAGLFPTSYRPMAYLCQLLVSIGGCFLSFRQVYFERTASRFFSCSTHTSNPFETVWHWLSAGAPACEKTMQIGPFTLAYWAFLIFGILTIMTFWVYFKGSPKRK